MLREASCWRRGSRQPCVASEVKKHEAAAAVARWLPRQRSCGRPRLPWLAGVWMSTLMALSFSLACIVPAVSSAAGTALAPDSEAPAVQQIATDWYASHFGVSKTVAAQRLQMQDAAMPQVELLPVLLGSSYGGAWFDPSDGGRLEIGVVDPVASAAAVSQALEAFAPSGVDAYTDIVPVRSSWSDLTSAEASLNSSLHNLLAAGLVQLSIDTSVNSVDVTTAATITPADQAEVQAAVANAPVSVRVVPSANSSLIAQTSACSVGAYIECDPPLRGGDFIFSSNGWECSATTVVEGSGIFYLMTAGHCGWVADQSGWSEDFSNGGGHAILPFRTSRGPYPSPMRAVGAGQGWLV